MTEVGILGALVAGMISFVSPCVLPLVPPYLCFLAGVTLDQLTGVGAAEARGAVRRRVFISALAFVAGFTTVFVALGASASAIGRLVLSYMNVLSYVAGAVIIVMGLHFLGLLRIGFLYREARVHVERKPAGPFGAYLVGLAFAFGWTPCIGPVLAAILFVAGTEDTVARGAGLLAVYSAGLGIPFLVASLFAGPFMRMMARFRRHMATVERTMGALLVLTGVMFLTGQMQSLSFWLLETFPGLARFG
ncbi:cytochrome c biogenesis CcdA family protein [Lutibaculum baratangense]|uniref:Cytochrome c-type biogenesis protein n=1 Tax=Lutibaculum baratangense AMV1 TaxID=631454 RepID=V4RGV6_9HYPH|nr:cytochrome c biogenesis protein CcdA [Lutibaculum baratangense]ESR24604.1 Cytochrome c-type biogenesis protein [Lutibaculum baratangense AMV1]